MKTKVPAIFTCLLALIVSMQPVRVQAQFTFVTNNNTITITGYAGTTANITIPSITNGYPVTAIGTFAFANNASMTNVSIPNSITNIGYSPFSDCSGLVSINVQAGDPYYSSQAGVLFNQNQTALIEFPPGKSGNYVIPGSVICISNAAFFVCGGLTNLTIGSSVGSIGDQAFESCYNLNNAIIPNSVTNLGQLAFYSCSSLTNTTIGTGVVLIGNEAFYGCYSLSTVAIGPNVGTIGVEAFYDCASLTNILLPSSVVTIDNQAFYLCENLKGVYFEGNAPYEDGPNVGYEVFLGAPNAIAYYILGTSGWGSFSGIGIPTAPWIPSSVEVTIGPDAAVLAGAQWNVDGGPFQTSGASVTNLSLGNHILNFKAVSGWTAPSSQIISLTANQVSSTTGTYSQQFGSLHVTINSPVSGDGAQWQVDGGTLENSGATESGLPAGSHVLTFSPVNGWTTPTNQIVTILANQITTTSGTYVSVFQTGAFTVNINPSTAASAGAQWQIDNGTNESNGTTALNLSVGNHTVTFTTISGWNAPSAQTVSVAANLTNTTTGTYTPESTNYASSFSYFITANNTITIIGYTGSGGNVTIPNNFGGIPVTSIGNNAFEDLSSITSVTIPSSVTTIGNYAFFGCENLTSAPLPDNLTSLGSEAFGFTSLSSVTIPPTVTNVGQNAFSFSTLANISFATNMSTVWNEAFEQCEVTNIILPNGVTNIQNNAFQGCSYLTNIVIPSGVTSIGNSAFESCPLASVKIPNSVVSIGSEAFEACPFSSITIPDSVTSIGLGAFEGDYSLTTVYVGNGVTNIGGEAFVNCYDLVNVTIGTNVTTIGENAFDNCYNLLRLVIPASVTTIGDSAFDNCNSLETIYFEGNAPFAGSYAFAEASPTAYYLPGNTGWNITYGDIYALGLNPAIPFTYEIIDGTVSITDYLGNAGSVTIPETITVNGVALPVVSIGNNAFYKCETLTNLAIPNTITSIGANAFAYTGLTSFVIPDNVTAIGQQAFYQCLSLTNVTLPNGLTTIGAGAFQGSDLAQVSIPNSVTQIGQSAFAGCTNLTQVVIGNAITSIGDYAFYYCPKLLAVFFQGNAPSVDSSVFYDDNSPIVYYLPGTTGWAQFLSTAGVSGKFWTLPYPLILTGQSGFGMQNNRFGFTVSWATNLSIVVQATTNLAKPVWTPLATNMLVNGTNYFSDPKWTNDPGRFYRLALPQ